MFVRITFYVVLFCVLAGFGGAQAQTLEEYLQQTPWLDVERDQNRPHGADDSTTGTMGIIDIRVPELSITPTSRTWTAPIQDFTFTVRNNGDFQTSPVTVTTPSGFTGPHNCHIIAGGGSCTIRLRPINESARVGYLRVRADTGGEVQARLEMIPPPPPAALTLSPGSGSWNQNKDWQNFTVRNTGGQPSGSISASLSSGAAHFDISPSCGALAPNAQCTVRVRPKSSATGDVSGTLRITASPGGTKTASLTATLTPPNPCAGAPASRQNATFRVEPACLFWDDVHGIKHIVITNIGSEVLFGSSDDGASIINPWRSGFILSGTAFGGTTCLRNLPPGAICRLGIQHLLITRPIGISSFNFPLYPTAQTRIGAKYGSQSIYADVHARCVNNCAYWVTQ